VELIWKPITDAVEWAALCARAEAVDGTGEIYTVADLAEELAEPSDDPSRRTGVWSDGALVGFAEARVRGQMPTIRVDLEGTVAPDHRGRGIGSHLIDWCLRRATGERDARIPGSPVDVSVTGYPDNPAQFELLASRGFRTRTWEALMTCQLAAVEPESVPQLPGFRVSTYEADRWDDVRVAHNESFSTDPGYVRWSQEEWRHWVEETAAARPALSLVAYEETADQVVSYVISQEYDGIRETTGLRELYVSRVGTLPDYRGQGLARRLLAGVVGLAADDGFNQVALHADTNNPTGAFKLYEAAGFVVTRLQERMYLTLPPTPDELSGGRVAAESI
jgi:mycothiol synthase